MNLSQLFDTGSHDVRGIRRDNEITSREYAKCSCMDCYVNAMGEHRCRCDYCLPSLAERLKMGQSRA